MAPAPPMQPDDDDDEAVDESNSSLSAQSAKVQRWIDILAALLRRRRPATFDELVDDVPAYGTRRRDDSLMRMFERDKDELRRFGIAIETFTSSDADRTGYHLATSSFYLPYLALRRDAVRPSGPPGYGYQSLDTVVFEPDEIDVIAEAADRAASLGDPQLRADAESALRKLSLDLPGARASARGDSDDDVHILVGSAGDAKAFGLLCDALARRKFVTFEYRGIERDERSSRTVEPYGIFLVSAHWYLAGRDRDKDALRNFRLSRVESLRVNGLTRQSPDFDVPGDFQLAVHARAREPWELGDGDAAQAIVEFRASSGAVEAAMRLGTVVDGAPFHRAFAIRRVDAFARWVLSFGGDVRPVAPEELVVAFARIARDALSRYDSAAATVVDSRGDTATRDAQPAGRRLPLPGRVPNVTGGAE